MSQKKTKSIFLRKYLFQNDYNIISKKTLLGLLNSAVLPVFSIKEKINIVYRIFDKEIISNLKKYIKRAEFLDIDLYDLKDLDCEEIQFLIISTSQYSACILFDFSLAEKSEDAVFSSFFNAKQTSDILKTLLPEEKFSAERRENTEFNTALSGLIKFCNDSLQELNYNEAEKQNLETLTQSLKRDEYLAQKARYISHEIKNHLSIIDIYAKIIEKTCENNEKIKDSVKLIFNSVSGITKLLQDLKGFSEANLNVYNLKTIIEESINVTKEMASCEKINIENELKKDLDVIIDKDKFQNVILNLIKNSIEALKETDRDNKYIKISCDNKGEKISLKIKNNGDEIEGKNRKKIFEEGFTTKSTGSGLGLFICKQNLKEQFCDLTLLKSDKNETIFEISMNKI